MKMFFFSYLERVISFPVLPVALLSMQDLNSSSSCKNTNQISGVIPYRHFLSLLRSEIQTISSDLLMDKATGHHAHVKMKTKQSSQQMVGKIN